MRPSSPLIEQLNTFLLTHWTLFAALAAVEAASFDRPGFLVFDGDLVVPTARLDFVRQPVTGRVPMIQFCGGPVWLDYPTEPSEPQPESLVAAAVSPESWSLTASWELERGRRVWAKVAGPVPPIDCAQKLLCHLLHVAKN